MFNVSILSASFDLKFSCSSLFEVFVPSGEQHELLQLTIEKIHFDGPAGEITIDYHPSGIQTLFERTSLQESEA